MAEGKIEYEVRADTSKMDGDLNKAEGKVDGWGSKVAKGVGVAAAAIGTAAVAAGGAAIKVGMDFESGMSQVAATLGYTSEDLNTVGSEAQVSFQKLEDAALKAGSTTKFTATEASEALNYMALAGWDVETSIAALPSVLAATAAANSDLGYMTDVVTDSMTALGLGIDDLDGFLDQMTRTSQRSNTSMEQLGEAYLTVGATARNLAGGTDELNLMLGLLADNGYKGSEGGTKLRNVILALSNPTDKAAKAMEDLGVSAYEADGSLRPMQDIIADLNTEMDGMTDEEKTNIIGTIFNKTDIGAVNALLGTSTERVEELSNEIANSAGATADAAATQQDNLAGMVTIVKSQMEGLGVAIYKGMEEPLKEGVSAFSDMLTTFQETGAIEALGETLGALGSVIAEALVDTLPIILELINELVPFMLEIAEAILPILLEVIQQLLPPLLEIIQAILPPLLALIDALLPIVQILLDLLTPLLDIFIALLEPILSLITDAFTPFLDIVVKVIDVAIKPLQGALEFLGDLFGSIFKTISDTVKTHINSVISIFKNIIDFVKNVFTGNWKGAWENIKNIFKAIADAIGNIFKAPINFIIGIINAFIRGLNKIKIPDWVPGVGGYGLNIPEIPSLRIGMDEVPEDEFPAILHKKEAVLTANDAELWRGIGGAQGIDRLLTAALTGTNDGVQKIYIETKVDLDGREVARGTAEYIGEQLAFEE